MKLGKITIVLFFIAIVSIGVIGYIYFFLVSPTFVDKPLVEKPTNIEKVGEIDQTHIKYLLNELDVYKLHNDPTTDEPPIIQVELIDLEDEFTFTVEDNNIEIFDSLNPDLIIKGGSNDVMEVLLSSDLEKSVVDAVYAGDIQIEIIADEKTLALKGYKSIYDKMSSNKVTGGVVTEFSLNKINNGLSISLLFFISLIVGLIIEKDN